ncbi:FAD-dependent oxidoreductase [candidate division KSB1 bacterium]|nr:FAD-dependent oxidoreductase [candidate division KSB1 bacterium]RQW06460.1 MAG: FAD-dependent oxidoreductase [candidate division KSB1 bacterium]
MFLSRRNFIAASALAGYSVIVDARGLLGQDGHADTPIQLPPFFESIAPDHSPGGMRAEPNMRLVELEVDVLVAGGGMSGVCAAISAARHGARVLLVQDRSRLGGNASSEIKMHIVGADNHGSRPGWREGGLIEELRLQDAMLNPTWNFEMWDLMLYDKCITEPNLNLLLDSSLYAAKVNDNKIDYVLVRCDKTEHLYKIKAHIYVDATGDARLALEAGADFRIGREGKAEFGESLAQEKADGLTQGSSILFTAREYDRPMPYKAPSWARTISKEHLKYRGAGQWAYGYWWIELGGMIDNIRENERLRFELLSVVLGTWDYIKNSGDIPDSANWALESVGMVPGKRESRRVLGDHILTQPDLEGAWKGFDDSVAIGGWNMDDHPPEGFDKPDQRPYNSVRLDEPYNIPFGSLYSRNIHNMMMAGRNISCSHVAFSSARVMATCSAIGQAVGTAAAQCFSQKILPRELRHDWNKIVTLQQMLLRDDQTIRLIKNDDPSDLAKTAKIYASDQHEDAAPEHIINGRVRDMPGEWKNRWAAKMTNDGAWIELQWEQPVVLSHIQITFDSGFQRELTLSAHPNNQKNGIRGAQPEVVKDYRLLAKTKKGDILLTEVTGNYQRLCRHDFEKVQMSALRLFILATNGAEEARVYEVRCYA